MQGFHTQSYRCCREMHFISSRLNIKFGQRQWSVKCRSRAPGHGVCSNRVSSTAYYARFHTPSYHCYREVHFISRLNIKISTKSVEHETVG